MIPREDVDVSVYPPSELPSSSCPYVGATASPVPPYNTPTDVVADTTPLFACSGPFREPSVTVLLNVFVPLQTLFVVVPNASEMLFAEICRGYVDEIILFRYAVFQSVDEAVTVL